MICRRLSFEDELFTARGYKRNYRTPKNKRKFERITKSNSQDDSSATAAGPHNKLRRSHVREPVSAGATSQVPVQEGSGQSGFSTADDLGLPMPDSTRGLSEMLLRKGKNQTSSAIADSQHPPIENLSQELFKACKLGDSARVQALLDQGCSELHLACHTKSYPGFRPIHVVASHGHARVFRLLLQYGVTTEDLTFTGWPPLYLASQCGYWRAGEVLLKAGANIAVRGPGRVQAVHVACEAGSLRTIELLVDSGATVTCADTSGRQPLHIVSESSDRPDLIRYLVIKGADKDAIMEFGSGNWQPLHFACMRDHPGNINASLGLGVRFDPKKGHPSSFSGCCQIYSPLHVAIEYFSVSAVQAILEHKSDSNSTLFDRQPSFDVLASACIPRRCASSRIDLQAISTVSPPRILIKASRPRMIKAIQYSAVWLASNCHIEMGMSLASRGFCLAAVAWTRMHSIYMKKPHYTSRLKPAIDSSCLYSYVQVLDFSPSQISSFLASVLPCPSI